MDGIAALLLPTVALISFASGIAVYKWFLVRSVRRQVAVAEQQAKEIRAKAREDAAKERQEHMESAHAALADRRRVLDGEREESQRALRRSKRNVAKRHDRLNRRTKRVNERESLLVKAGDLFDTLRRKAEQTHRQAELLRANADTLLHEATTRRASLQDLESSLATRRERLDASKEKLDGLVGKATRALERISGLSADEAREALCAELIDEARLKASAHIKDVRDQAKLTAARQARKVIVSTIQRTAASHAIENTVSVVNIQSEEMKGRIIGREGRNIRAFEAVTGIEVIVDDTPEAVILSGFDPVRREIARIALDRLVRDGRIHPARIEEVVEKTRASMDEEIIEIGERTIIDLNLHGLHPEIIRHIGRMRYRTSYGQNLLAHSMETARIASIMAAEIGLDTTKSRRAGLLHDIGKVIEDAVDQPHALAGMEMCKRYGEADDVCNAIGAHHDEIEMTALISPVVQAADAISGARPGARRESLQSYIKRLEDLEDIAMSFNGVDRAFAIQAGREVRVLVNHDKVSDKNAAALASDISERIEREMKYPGQIRVTVIREVRKVSYAK